MFRNVFQDFRSSVKHEKSSTRNTSENNDDDDATEHIHRNNETNLADLNINNNHNIKNVENNIRLLASADAIIKAMTSLMAVDIVELS